MLRSTAASPMPGATRGEARHERGPSPGFSNFYHLGSGLPADAICSGTACFAARGREPATWESRLGESARTYCLGRCYEAPARRDRADDGPPHIGAHGVEPIVLAGVIDGGGPGIEAYRSRGGYSALQRAINDGPEVVIREIEASRIRGRGGAGFPAGRKWAATAAVSASPKFVIANADEGDPGAYIDRLILERDPHLVIEGLTIAALAVGAERGFIYLRLEYPEAAQILRRALVEARDDGVLGDALLGSGPACDIELFIGEGSYLCGEETALMRSIEARRPEPSARPPYPSDSGLFSMPTLVQNVETLASIPFILSRGGSAYAEYGTATSTGTKAVSLNSLFARPGLYEVEFGIPLREIVEEVGGGLESGELLGVIVGGPIAGMVPPSLLDTPFAFDEMRDIGCAVGHGGIIAFDTTTSIDAIVNHVAAFAAYESCGKCTPCRSGSGRIERAFAPGTSGDMAIGEFEEVAVALSQTSLCGHGGGLGDFLRAIARHYPDEVSAWLA